MVALCSFMFLLHQLEAVELSTHLKHAGLDGQALHAVGAHADLGFDPQTALVGHAPELESGLGACVRLGTPIGLRLCIKLYPVRLALQPSHQQRRCGHVMEIGPIADARNREEIFTFTRKNPRLGMNQTGATAGAMVSFPVPCRRFVAVGSETPEPAAKTNFPLE